jgi:hypothetical protein
MLMMLLVVQLLLMLDWRLFCAWKRATSTDVLTVWIFATVCLCWLTTAGVFARAVGLGWQRAWLVWQIAVHI